MNCYTELNHEEIHGEWCGTRASFSPSSSVSTCQFHPQRSTTIFSYQNKRAKPGYLPKPMVFFENRGALYT